MVLDPKLFSRLVNKEWEKMTTNPSVSALMSLGSLPSIASMSKKEFSFFRLWSKDIRNHLIEHEMENFQLFSQLMFLKEVGEELVPNADWGNKQIKQLTIKNFTVIQIKTISICSRRLEIIGSQYKFAELNGRQICQWKLTAFGDLCDWLARIELRKNDLIIVSLLDEDLESNNIFLNMSSGFSDRSLIFLHTQDGKPPILTPSPPPEKIHWNNSSTINIFTEYFRFLKQE